MVTIPRATGLALLLMLATGPVVSDAGVACRQGCGAAHRGCRRRVVADLRRERRSCAALFVGGRRCSPGGDCLGFATLAECRTDAGSFGRVRFDRCGRIRDRCWTCCDGATRCSGAALTVNDPDFLGSVGDGALSLTEALRLARGDLPLAALSDAERGQVRGEPGAGRADLVRFAPGLTVAVHRRDGPVDVMLPPLTDAGDAIAGDGTLFDGGPMGGEPQAATTDTFAATEAQFGRVSMAALLVVAASDVEVAGLRIDRVVAPHFVVAGQPGDVTGVLVHDNVLTGIDRSVPVLGVVVTAGGGASGRRVSDVWVRDNHFTDIDQAISVSAGSALATGAASGNVAERVHVVGNVVERPTEGIALCAATAALGGSIADNVLTGVTVEHNRLIEPLDAGLIVSTTCIVDGGTAARNQALDVHLRRNAIVSPPVLGRQNTAMFLSGGQVALTDAAADDGDHVDGLEVAENVVDGTLSGALVVGGYAERCAGCRTTGGLVENVAFHGNTWRNVEIGLVLEGGAAGETAATVAGNALRNVTITGDDIQATGSGLVVQGATVFALPLGGPFFLSAMQFPGYHLPGTVTDGQVVALTFTANHVQAQDGATVLGGSSIATEDAVSGGLVRDLTFDGNTFVTGRSGFTVVGGIVTTSGTVSGSQVDGVGGSGNVAGGGGPVGVFSTNQLVVSGAPPGSVQANSVASIGIR